MRIDDKLLRQDALLTNSMDHDAYPRDANSHQILTFSRITLLVCRENVVRALDF
jgi:hypothetical protein